jgi:hypothetical protein
VVIAGVRAAVEMMNLETQIQIAQILAKFDHGGAAAAWLDRVREGPRRPLPGRALTSVPSSPPASEPA